MEKLKRNKKSQKIGMDFTNIGIFKRKCIICGKEIISLNELQFENNWRNHMLMHDKII